MECVKIELRHVLKSCLYVMWYMMEGMILSGVIKPQQMKQNTGMLGLYNTCTYTCTCTCYSKWGFE